MSRSSIYRYTPLSEARSTRLVVLLPSTDPSYAGHDASKRINVHLQAHEVDSLEPTYEALSYTWADDANDKTLSEPIYHHTSSSSSSSSSSAGKALHVTKNCKAALLRLRLPTTPRTLWIDAVCIDQANGVEKARQIPLMRDIYGSAGRVLVWLGAGNARSDLAIWSLRAFAEERRRFRALGRKSFQTPGMKKLKRRLHRIPSGEDEMGDDDEEKEEEEGGGGGGVSPDPEVLIELFGRPYWTRVWTIQEATLGRVVMVLCGEEEISYACVEELHDALHELGAGLGFYNSLFAFGINVITLSRLRYRRRKYEGFRTVLPGIGGGEDEEEDDVLRLLCGARRSQATDERDYVFGVGGLLTTHHETDLPEPDARKSAADIFIEVARSIVARSARLQILSNVSGVPRVAGLPGWVPDWSNTDHNSFCWERFHATGSSKAVIDWEVEDTRILRVKGHMIAVLAKVFDYARPARHEKHVDKGEVDQAGREDRYDRDCVRVWRHWLAEAGAEREDESGAGAWPTLWRTLCWGTTADERGLEYMEEEVDGATTEALEESARAWRSLLLPSLTTPIGENDDEATDRAIRHSSAAAFARRARLAATEKALAVTQEGELALVPAYARTGDALALLAGDRLPHVLRRDEDGGERDKFVYVGCAYYRPAMYGELWKGIKGCGWMVLGEKAPSWDG